MELSLKALTMPPLDIYLGRMTDQSDHFGRGADNGTWRHWLIVVAPCIPRRHKGETIQIKNKRKDLKSLYCCFRTMLKYKSLVEVNLKEKQTIKPKLIRMQSNAIASW